MVNRINLILQAMNITPKQFAEEIGIQPSGMSHILSGRNQPSRDFVTKVIRRYPEISIKWLMLGDGPMYDALYSAPQTPSQQSMPSSVPESDEGFRAASGSGLQSSSSGSAEGASSLSSSQNGVRNYVFQDKGSVVAPDLFSSVVNENTVGRNVEMQNSSSESTIAFSNPGETNLSKNVEQTQSDYSSLHTSNELESSVFEYEGAKLAKKSDVKVVNVEPLKNEYQQPVSSNSAVEMPISENSKNETNPMLGFNPAILANQKKIVKMIVIYDDHTFAEYRPE